MSDILQRLKERKLVQWALAYAAGAFALLQGVDIVAQRFGWPESVERLLIIALAVGFFVILVLAWYHGERGAQRVSGTELLILALLLAIGGAILWRFAAGGAEQSVPVASRTAPAGVRKANAPTAQKSIAVLPFANMSSDAEQEYFSDGMTEEILNALAKVPGLAVTARTSVFSLKGAKKDVREIGTLLGVTYVLEGSVRRAGDEVRITAQLIRTDNGFHLWSETYDRKLDHVFALQAELAGAIAKALALPLGVGGDAALVNQRMDDPEAYALYLQARAAYRARGDGVKRSIELYREVLKRDPKYAPAWSGLCGSLTVLTWYVSGDELANTARNLDEAVEAGERALALSPDSVDAHIMLALVYTYQWRWNLADQHFQRALALAPNDAELLLDRAWWLAAMGRREEALHSAQRATATDPLVPIFRNFLGLLLFQAGRNDESIAVLEAAHELAPDLSLVAVNLAQSYLRGGRADDAERVLDSMKVPPSETVLQLRAAIRLVRDPSLRETIRRESGDAVLGYALAVLNWTDVDLLFIAIEKRMDLHLSGAMPVMALRSDALAEHRQDPRYIALLRKAGFDAAGLPLPDGAPR
jgi:TolB-like protein/Tfp pilus assembly protein PilF